ncbi:uncharacterized protein [Gorilla gorilla gorilla]|uniref:uncharacterized protein n=1 Tax=Gorilla gorilla gorilla TaxID=9595 RepID=UPI00244599E5|nr:uncharacterized protein LOC129532903 [Gorilla gorilla gorilla]XP_055240130.1 uncharacterized protein LOC129532903 [Gorilla gorilla gorilla]
MSAASLLKSARPQTQQKEETADTSEHLKEQTLDTPSLRTVTLTVRVHRFILEVSQTKNPPIPSLTLLPKLECSVVIKAHCSLNILIPSVPPTSASQVAGTTVCLNHVIGP